MAKKRRRSKWERKAKERIRIKPIWIDLMENVEFLYRIFNAVENLKEPVEGDFIVIGNTLTYYVVDDEENVRGYEVAVLGKDGVFIYDMPYSYDEAPF